MSAAVSRRCPGPRGRFPRVTHPCAAAGAEAPAARLACVKRAASVRPEPGSNSQLGPFVPATCWLTKVDSAVIRPRPAPKGRQPVPPRRLQDPPEDAQDSDDPRRRLRIPSRHNQPTMRKSTRDDESGPCAVRCTLAGPSISGSRRSRRETSCGYGLLLVKAASDHSRHAAVANLFLASSRAAASRYLVLVASSVKDRTGDLLIRERHRTDRIARLAARTGNAVTLPLMSGGRSGRRAAAGSRQDRGSRPRPRGNRR